jgi:putative intracellular protease/amidase
MRRLNVFIAVLLLAVAVSGSAVFAENVKILIVIPDHYGANYFLALNDFERIGWDITTTGVNQFCNPCQSYAAGLLCPSIPVDLRIANIPDVTVYDIVLVTSGSFYDGNACGDLIASPEAMQLLVDANEAGMVVAGYCTGVRALAASGILSGVPVTGNPNYASEYIAAGATWLGPQLPPVVSGNIVTTCRGMYFHVENAEAIALALENLQSQTASK